MIDLESATAFVHWASDDFELPQGQQPIERSVWHHTAILSYAIADSCVTFDAPAEWGNVASAILLQKRADGNYEYHAQHATFKGVRAETRTHVIITGRWTSLRADGSGLFIAVLPVQQSQIAIEKIVQAVPVGNYA